MSTDGWLTGSNAKNSVSDRNLEVKYNENLVPEYLILILTLCSLYKTWKVTQLILNNEV